MSTPEHDPETIVQDTIDHLTDWLAGAKQVSELVPYAQQLLEDKQWELDALQNRPAGSGITFGDLPTQFQQESLLIKQAYPALPPFTISSATTSTAAATAGNTAFYEFVNQHQTLGTSGAIAYATEYTQKYQRLQEDHDRPTQIRRLLVSLGNHKTIEEFDDACNLYRSLQASVASRHTAANAIRRALHAVRGDLINKANLPGGTPSRDKWSHMAQQLAQPPSIEPLLGREEVNYKSLHDDLSQIVHASEGQTPLDLPTIWTRFLDHVYSVLGLIGLTPAP